MLEINKVYQGDCLELLQQIDNESVDMILCDLPYGTTACTWDSIIPLEDLWKHYKRIIKNDGAIVLTATQPFTSMLVSSNMSMFKYEWIWAKSRAVGFPNAKNKPMNRHESILVFSKGNCANRCKNRMKYNPQGLIEVNKIVNGIKACKGDIGGHHFARPSHKDKRIQQFTNFPTSVLNIKNDGKTVHPTQKPLELFEYLILTYTNENDIVLDNCAGSGTTGLAAIKTGRNYVLMEKDPKYFSISENRIKESKEKQTT